MHLQLNFAPLLVTLLIGSTTAHPLFQRRGAPAPADAGKAVKSGMNELDNLIESLSRSSEAKAPGLSKVKSQTRPKLHRLVVVERPGTASGAKLEDYNDLLSKLPRSKEKIIPVPGAPKKPQAIDARQPIQPQQAPKIVGEQPQPKQWDGMINPKTQAELKQIHPDQWVEGFEGSIYKTHVTDKHPDFKAITGTEDVAQQKTPEFQKFVDQRKLGHDQAVAKAATAKAAAGEAAAVEAAVEKKIAKLNTPDIQELVHQRQLERDKAAAAVAAAKSAPDGVTAKPKKPSLLSGMRVAEKAKRAGAAAKAKISGIFGKSSGAAPASVARK
ncbi:hypothetical protein FRB94_012039 [Tulasnella sp. JGI-2019a]|nr:hypothetical protein FRB94_012039 [Tulasnella sp. JGI-2019a]